MTNDEVKRTLDVLESWTPPEGLYYVLGYAPFHGGKLVISFGKSPEFGDKGQTFDIELNEVPTHEGLNKIESVLLVKLFVLPFVGFRQDGTPALSEGG